MKVPWSVLVLATLLAFAPTATATVEERHAGMQPAQRGSPCYGYGGGYYSGCYSHIHSAPVEEDPSHLPPEVPGLEELPTAQGWPSDSKITILRPSRLSVSSLEELLRQKRDTERASPGLAWFKEEVLRRYRQKRAAPARRRGKQRSTRPVCRGCFSGLMLWDRPAPEGTKATRPGSTSESGGDSSEGD